MKAQLQIKFLQFQEHSAETFLKLLSSKEFCDVILIGEDLIPIDAHRIILSAFSRNLKGIVKQLNEGENEIVLRGMDHKDIESLLQFMYLGEVSIAHASVDKFLRTAKFLGISQLRDQSKVDIEDLNREFGVRLSRGVIESEKAFEKNTNLYEEMEEQECGVRIDEDCEEALNRKFGTPRREKESMESLKEEDMDEDYAEEDICIDEVLEEYSQTEGDDKDIEEEIVGGIVNTNKEDKINLSSTAEEENYLDNVTVGKVEDNFSIHVSVLYSHNYFRKISRDEYGKKYALCIMCWKLRRTKVFLKITDNNIKGKLYFRRRNCSHTIFFRFECSFRIKTHRICR